MTSLCHHREITPRYAFLYQREEVVQLCVINVLRPWRWLAAKRLAGPPGEFEPVTIDDPVGSWSPPMQSGLSILFPTIYEPVRRWERGALRRSPFCVPAICVPPFCGWLLSPQGSPPLRPTRRSRAAGLVPPPWDRSPRSDTARRRIAGLPRRPGRGPPWVSHRR
jgi:hypothetical protein